MNNLRCRPGDLAVVIAADCRPNLGRIVKVIKMDDGQGTLRFAAERQAWLVESRHPLTWFKGGQKIRARRGPVPDCQLQPIRGAPPHPVPNDRACSQDASPLGPANTFDN